MELGPCLASGLRFAEDAWHVDREICMHTKGYWQSLPVRSFASMFSRNNKRLWPLSQAIVLLGPQGVLGPG